MKLDFPVFIISISHYFIVAVADEQTKLLFVQILFRHGDRTPYKTFPNDMHPESVWPGGLGQLTLLGKKQQYALGQYLRSRYQNFTTSSPLEIRVNSTSLDRCLESAATNLAAFYAPVDEWVFEEALKWQPIPIHYVPQEVDKYLRVSSYCPRADAEQRRVLNSPESRKLLAESEEMFENLSYHSGKVIQDWREASELFDALWVQRKYNLTIPSWAISYWDALDFVNNLCFYWLYNSPLLHRLRAGPFIGNLIENMQKKIQGDIPHLKFHLYSAHDTNIAVVLNALNLFNMKQPPYCAALLFELHENIAGTKVIRILYQNSSAVEESIQTPHILILKGCTEFCPLDYFINYTRHLIPENWSMECQLKISDDQIREQVLMDWYFIFAGIVIIAGTFYALWKLFIDRKKILITN